MKVIAFGASSSKESINKQLATWVAEHIPGESRILDLNDYEMPIYSIDREKTEGIPALADQFKQEINQADAIIISFTEHNGSYSAAFKNVFDWISRIEKPIWSSKPMFLLSTSPGPRGGKGVLATATTSFPHQGGNVVASFSLPAFRSNFSLLEGITNKDLANDFDEQLQKFMSSITLNATV